MEIRVAVPQNLCRVRESGGPKSATRLKDAQELVGDALLTGFYGDCRYVSDDFALGEDLENWFVLLLIEERRADMSRNEYVRLALENQDRRSQQSLDETKRKIIETAFAGEARFAEGSSNWWNGAGACRYSRSERERKNGQPYLVQHVICKTMVEGYAMAVGSHSTEEGDDVLRRLADDAHRALTAVVFMSTVIEKAGR